MSFTALNLRTVESCEEAEVNRRVFVVVGVVFLVVLVVPAVASARPYLDRHTFCHSIGSSSSDYRPIRESDTFYTTETEVYSWTRLTNVRGSHMIHWLWIDPEKFDSVLGDYRIPAGADPSLPYYVWHSMYLNNGSIPVGRWRLLVYLDGSLLYEDTFMVVPGWIDEMQSNDTAARAEFVQMGEQIHGFTTREDEDWYKITIPRSGQYYVHFSRYRSYTQRMLSVFSEGNLVTPLIHLGDRESDESGWNGYWEECVLLTRPGSYFIRVHGYTATDVEYWLNLTERMPWWIE